MHPQAVGLTVLIYLTCLVASAPVNKRREVQLQARPQGFGSKANSGMPAFTPAPGGRKAQVKGRFKAPAPDQRSFLSAVPWRGRGPSRDITKKKCKQNRAMLKKERKQQAQKTSLRAGWLALRMRRSQNEAKEPGP